MRRHVDQLRTCYPAPSSAKDNNSDDSCLPFHRVTDNVIPAGSSAPATLFVDPHSPAGPPSPAPSSSASATPPRRSTRVRKPVQRFSCSVQT